MAQPTERQRTNDEWVRTLRGDLGAAQQESAFADLGHFLYKRVYNYLKSTGSKQGHFVPESELADIAAEVAQETIIKVFQERLYEQYQGRDGATFTTFIGVIAVRRTIDLIRHRWRFQFVSMPDDDPQDAQDGTTLSPLIDSGAVDPVLRQEITTLWADLQSCVNALGQVRRQAFVWIEEQELPAEEVAQHLQRSVNAVYQLLYHARADIRDCLIKKGWLLSDIQRLYAS